MNQLHQNNSATTPLTAANQNETLERQFQSVIDGTATLSETMRLNQEQRTKEARNGAIGISFAGLALVAFALYATPTEDMPAPLQTAGNGVKSAVDWVISPFKVK